MDALNCTRYTCEGCNALFESKRPKRYCTRKCNKQHLRKIGSQSTRSEYIANRRENAASKFYCACCGVESRRPLSGLNKAKGYTNKYCSMACRINQAKRINAEREFFQGLAQPHRLAAVSQVKFISAVKAVAKVLSRYVSHREKAEKPCLSCGCAMGYTFGRARLYCSFICSKKTELFKASKKSSKLKRKAIKRGANGGESINPLKVFADAGWKCQICNKSTPQRLRGSIHKRAPELDHVVALSNGGTHTWVNVQCACRECNGWKSNKIVIGQQNLFRV